MLGFLNLCSHKEGSQASALTLEHTFLGESSDLTSIRADPGEEQQLEVVPGSPEGYTELCVE